MTEKVEQRSDTASEAAPDTKPKPTKAERLEAKAARLREAADRRAADAAAGHVPDRRPFVIATAVLAVVAVALGALLLVTFLAWQHEKDRHSAGGAPQPSGGPAATGASSTPPPDLASPTVEGAVNAAKSFAVDFGSYDYQHLDTEFEEVAKRMTPDFAQSYLQTSDRLKPTFVQYKTRVVASIQGYGVTSAGPTEAVVVVFLDQTVHTSQSGTPRIDRNRLEIHLVRTDGQWLVSKLLAK